MFTRMDQSTEQEWQHIYEEHLPHVAGMPRRIISMLEQMKGLSLGFGTDQHHHSLQTATMARRGGADDEMIVVSLIHDIGKVINVPNHGQICAEIIKPYVTDEAYHIVRTHQDFQGQHYYHFQIYLQEEFDFLGLSTPYSLASLQVPLDNHQIDLISMIQLHHHQL